MPGGVGHLGRPAPGSVLTALALQHNGTAACSRPASLARSGWPGVNPQCAHVPQITRFLRERPLRCTSSSNSMVPRRAPVSWPYWASRPYVQPARLSYRHFHALLGACAIAQRHRATTKRPSATASSADAIQRVCSDRRLRAATIEYRFSSSTGREAQSLRLV